MNCMKCGREVPAEQVFCEECLLEMEKYPVRPGTVVQLPRRKDSAVPKKTPKRRMVSLEDQVRILKKQVKWLCIALVLSLILAGTLAVPAFEHMKEDHFKKGQNYNTVTQPTNPSEPTAP